ncbi:MAG: DUF2726 domain-containing protein [Syntrophomonadaceae bacterium]
MAQLIFLALVVLVLYFVSDIIKKLLAAKSGAQPGKKGEEVLDVSNAWIDLSNLPYQARKHFLNASEEKLLAMLQELVGRDQAVYPKVRLAEIIELTGEASHRSEYLRRLRERCCDFLICQSHLDSPLMLVMTENRHDDDNHRQNRDFALRAAQAAGLPVIVINLDHLPDRAALLQSLQKAGLPLQY